MPQRARFAFLAAFQLGKKPMTVQRRRRIIKRRRSSVGLALVAAISFLAGMTDAIGLMSIGDFVSFMSGNTTRASVALVQGDAAQGLLLIGGLVSFVLGNAAGVMISIRFRPQAALLFVSALLACAAFARRPTRTPFRFAHFRHGSGQRLCRADRRSAGWSDVRHGSTLAVRPWTRTVGDGRPQHAVDHSDRAVARHVCRSHHGRGPGARSRGSRSMGAIACRPVAYCRSVPDTPPLAK